MKRLTNTAELLTDCDLRYDILADVIGNSETELHSTDEHDTDSDVDGVISSPWLQKKFMYK